MLDYCIGPSLRYCLHAVILNFVHLYIGVLVPASLEEKLPEVDTSSQVLELQLLSKKNLKSLDRIKRKIIILDGLLSCSTGINILPKGAY